jgi:2-isopropylmalate synthase
MSPYKKARMFELLVKMGFKEIEVGFPAASRTEHAFVRKLIEEGLIPDDVTITVLTQAKDDLIEQTALALRGANSATIHLYSATSEQFQRLVFGMTPDECVQLATRGTERVLYHAERHLSATAFAYQYSPELFSETPTDFALEVCNRVIDIYQPCEGHEITFALPATVERSTPNTYADQIEYFGRHVSHRPHVTISLHPHNDRGTAVAAAELGLMAGGDRVEGCLFGHGERTGNVDLVTLGLNLLSQGVDPRLDLSDLGTIQETVESCTGIPIPVRQPYAGELVYTAFSGSHQDAIKKGFDELAAHVQKEGISPVDAAWEVPYLPIDPRDVGRTYEAIIRVNSQSGKGGVAYVLQEDFGLHLPRELCSDLSPRVQRIADATGEEVASQEILDLFVETYVAPGRKAAETLIKTFSAGVKVRFWSTHFSGCGTGKNALDAALEAVLSAGIVARAVTVHDEMVFMPDGPTHLVYLKLDVGGAAAWGAGMAADPDTASVQAVVSAVATSVDARATFERAGALRVPDVVSA